MGLVCSITECSARAPYYSEYVFIINCSSYLPLSPFRSLGLMNDANSRSRVATQPCACLIELLSIRNRFGSHTRDELMHAMYSNERLPLSSFLLSCTPLPSQLKCLTMPNHTSVVRIIFISCVCACLGVRFSIFKTFITP